VAYLRLSAIAATLLVFAVAAWSKAYGRAARQAFAASLRPLRLVPDRYVGALAVAAIAAEFTVAAVLAWALLGALGTVPGTDPAGRVGLTAAAALLVVLSAGIARALRRGTAATCACFGATARPLGRRHLVRNSLIGAIALAGLAAGAGDAHRGLAGSVGALIAGAAAALTLMHLDDLIELYASERGTARRIDTRRIDTRS
jgi:hypothetical protein